MKTHYYVSIAMMTFLLGVNAQVINQNNVNASLYDNGFFFTDSINSIARYEVPAGSGTNAIFSGSFWFGGVDVNGQVKLAAQQYGGHDYWSGPATRHNPYEWAPNDWPTIQDYFGQTYWEITKSEIDYHIANYQSGTYVMPADIANWPAHGDTSLGTSNGMLSHIAPFVDINNNGVYEPFLGDYPCIKGDAAVYIIMSDVGGFHTGSGGDPIGAEFHFMFYQYATVPELVNTTFVDIEVVNMGTQTIFETTASFFLDSDLGNYADDFVGTDLARNMIFTYNADNLDETNGGSLGYGANPPALGLKLLSHDLDYSISYSNAAVFPQSDPINAAQFYSAMRGNWADGSEQLDNNNQPSDYFYTGDPNSPNTWSENNMLNTPGDRRMLASTDLGTFTPDFTTGGSQRIQLSYAIVFAQGTDNLNSVTELQSLADFVQNFYDNSTSNCFDLSLAGIPTINSIEFTVQPNPNDGSFVLNVAEIQGNETVRIYDNAGRIVHEQALLNASTSLNVQLTEGLYHLEVRSGNAQAVKKMLVH